MAADVVVVGQLARDLVLRVGDAPGPGEAVPVRSRRELLGGKGSNLAVGLSQLAVPTALVGAVGADRVAGSLMAQAAADGIDTAAVARREDGDTALIVDVVDDHGRWRYLEHVPEAMLVTGRDVFAASAAIGAASFVVVELQQPVQTALTAARLAHAAGARVVLDGAPDDPAPAGELLALADVVRADAREAGQLSGVPVDSVPRAVRAGQDLAARGPWLVVLEVAGQGNLFLTGEGYEFLPLLDTTVVDTTGSGDALVATLTGALVRGRHHRTASRLAVAAAAATAEHAGGRPRLTPDDLDRTP